MKLLLSFISFLLVQNLFGQYKIDPKVEVEFLQLFNSLPRDLQQKRYLLDSADGGFAIFPTFKLDTLNANDYKYRDRDEQINEVELFAIDPVTRERIPDEPLNDTGALNIKLWMPIGAVNSKDTLFLGTYIIGLGGGVTCLMKIHKNKSSATYSEYGEKVYKYNLKSKKVDNITVGAKLENVVLSKFPKKSGEVFYGKATFTSLSFYQYDPAFYSGYIRQKHVMELIFICKLSKQEKRSKSVKDSKDIPRKLK